MLSCRRREDNVEAAPLHPPDPPKSPQNTFPPFREWVALLMGFTAALRGGSGCKNLGLIILEVLCNLSDSMKKRRTGQQ